MIKPWLFDIFMYPGDPAPEAFDPALCQRTYDQYLARWTMAERRGLEGVFFSEHHVRALRELRAVSRSSSEPKIRLAYRIHLQQLVGRTFGIDPAVLEDIAVIGHLQRGVYILLDDADRNPFVADVT